MNKKTIALWLGILLSVGGGIVTVYAEGNPVYTGLQCIAVIALISGIGWLLALATIWNHPWAEALFDLNAQPRWLTGRSTVTIRAYREIEDIWSESPDFIILGSAKNPKELKVITATPRESTRTYPCLSYFVGTRRLKDWTEALITVGAYIDPQSEHLMYQGEILD